MILQFCSFAYSLIASSVDPDQKLCSVASDQDIHYLKKSILLGIRPTCLAY